MLDKPVYKLREGSKLWGLHKIRESLEDKVVATLGELDLDYIKDSKHFGYSYKPSDYDENPELYQLKRGKYYIRKGTEKYQYYNEKLEEAKIDSFRKLDGNMKLIYIRFYAEKGSFFSPLKPEKHNGNYYIGGENVAHNDYLYESYEPIPYDQYLKEVEQNWTYSPM